MKKKILLGIGFILCILLGIFLGFKIADLGKNNNNNNTTNNEVILEPR